MRLLLIDAKEFSYNPERKTGISDDLYSEGLNSKEIYSNCLLVNIAIESHDSPETANNALRDIFEIAKNNENNSLVLLPNVHLTHNPADPDKALSMLRALYHEANDIDETTVHLEPFGFTGSLTLKTKGHTSSVLGRNY